MAANLVTLNGTPAHSKSIIFKKELKPPDGNEECSEYGNIYAKMCNASVYNKKQNVPSHGLKSFNDSINTNLDKDIDERNTPVSGERVVLFRHNSVRVTAYYPLSTLNFSSLKTMALPDRNAEAQKTIVLEKGPLEIYQIIVPSISPPSQSLTYLCLGRKADIIRPILPKLKISMLSDETSIYWVFMFNPDHFWKVEFLDADDYNQLNILFENTIKSICRYTNELTVDEDESADNDGEKEEEDDDDLEYLLYMDEPERNGGNPPFALSNDSSDVNTQPPHATEPINHAFKRAIGDVLGSALRNQAELGPVRLSSPLPVTDELSGTHENSSPVNSKLSKLWRWIEGE
ncbi:HER169Cp [Eremothecium sinecaudum]|uniref:Inheritance of peroxisomes protein 1 n=1 Tax=Eremothecium sinecaudum TaxID=45286 RepID=A0A109UZJ1_9SACH|nr:HER169Cp [Eremothecium sinecaudum]AMD21448.1 HER169Cp [Eremothecium sinecaudum]